ncbi:MAG: DUF692 family protein [Deltaproteobacteria bacterium]|nr:DUF692 family protein [Deltaproteobacteria bacterium]
MIKATPFTKRLVNSCQAVEIKKPPEPSWLPADKTRLLHLDIGLAEDGFELTIAKLKPYFKEKEIALFSCDLGPSAVMRRRTIPLSPVLKLPEIKRLFERSIKLIREIYAGPIGVENYNYFPTGLYEHICQPQIISELVEEFDIYLVVDLAHAAISAYNLNVPIDNYLEALPWSRVREIHLSTPFIPLLKGPMALDSHDSPKKREFDWLVKALDLFESSNQNLNLNSQLNKALPPPFVVVEFYRSHNTIVRVFTKTAQYLKEPEVTFK